MNEDFGPSVGLDEDVIAEIIRVKERTARRERRQDWGVVAAVGLGFVLLLVGGSVMMIGGGVSGGSGLMGLVMALAGGLLVIAGGVCQTFLLRAAVRAFSSSGEQTGIEGHYRNVYPGEFAEAERREKASARRRAQEAALEKHAKALRVSRGAINRERRREKRGVGQ